MTNRHDENLPKTVAVIMTEIPSIALSAGWAYLKTKRRVRVGSKFLMKGMLDNGMPQDLARMLADQYESTLSVRNLIHTVRGSSSAWTGWDFP